MTGKPRTKPWHYAPAFGDPATKTACGLPAGRRGNFRTTSHKEGVDCPACRAELDGCGWCREKCPEGHAYCSPSCEDAFLARHCRPCLRDRRDWPD